MPTVAMVAVLSALGMLIGGGNSSVVVTWAAVLSPIIAAGFGAYLTFRLRQVHTLVNNAASISDRRNAQLVDALTAAGIPVPDTTQQTGPA